MLLDELTGLEPESYPEPTAPSTGWLALVLEQEQLTESALMEELIADFL
jgi:hypothetical protein